MRCTKYIPGLGIAFLAFSPYNSYGQFTNVIGNHVLDAAGMLVASGSICFQPIDKLNEPIAISLYPSGPSSTASLLGPFCSPISNGSIIALRVPDPSTTFPSNYEYQVTIWNSATG